MGFKSLTVQSKYQEKSVMEQINDTKLKPTNFSIERILLKSDDGSKDSSTSNPRSLKPALNKVLSNPWVPASPYLFTPKVIQHDQRSPEIKYEPPAEYTPPPPSALASFHPIYSPLLRLPSLAAAAAAASGVVNCDIPQSSSLFASTSNEHHVFNNNILAVNNYNYYFNNHYKQCNSLSVSGDGFVGCLERTLTGLSSNSNSPLGVAGSSFGEEGQKCAICDKVFGCTETLEAHEKSHRSPRYECQECGKGFSQLRNFKYHVSVHRGTKEFAAKCPECGKVFNDKGYLSSHMKIHRNKKEYECPHCPKSFNQRVAFNMHIRIHTGVKPHKCEECGKKFSRKMLLKQHARTHSGEKPYQCTVCGKQFADRSNMTLHHRLHSGIKPFACPICPKAFTKKHHLKTHLNYHTGYKPYRCPHPGCGQTFTQSSNMRTHAKKCQFKPPTS